MSDMTKVLARVAVLLSVPAIQVLFGYWAYAAYKDNQPSSVPPLSLEGVIVVWFVVDLLMVVLGLRLLARHEAGRGAAWRRGGLRVGTTLSGAALGLHMLLGYWWVMAYTQGPRLGAAGECPECFRLALREENALEAVHPAVVFLIWVGVDIALVRLAVLLAGRRRPATAGPFLIGDVW